MTSEHTERDPVDRLAEEFVARFRSGERPSISDYTQKYPELAGQLHEILSAIVLIEQHGPVAAQRDALPEPIESQTPVPQQLGEYRILREIGRGGMGIVFEAVQQPLGRHVALKVLPSHALLDSLRLKRFHHEAQAAARLHHTNIVPVFGVGTEAGVHFYAMQFIEGRGLDVVIDEIRRQKQAAEAHPPVPAEARTMPHGASETPLAANLSTLSDTPRYYENVARLGTQVADALAHAHREGILHRDIKPANLLLDAAGTVWVTDFGLAKAQGLAELTQTGGLVGTLRYTPPERLRGDAGDERSDVYSLGLTLYELLALRPAFSAEERPSLIRQITQDEPIRPRRFDPRIPRDLETIVLKAIAKDPSARYRTAAELADDLRRFLADRPIEARRTTWWEHAVRWCRRNPALSVSLAATLIALVAGLSVSLWQWNRAERGFRRAKESADQASASAAAAEASAKQSQQDLVLALQAIDRMLEQVGAEHGVERELMTPEQRHTRLEALRFYQALLQQLPYGHSLPHFEITRAHWRLEQIYSDLGDLPLAERHRALALALLNRLLAEQPTEPRNRRLAAQLYLRQAMAWSDQLEIAKAETELRKSLELWRGLCKDDPADQQAKIGFGQVANDLAALLRHQSRYTEAELLLRQSVDLLEGPFTDTVSAHYGRHYLILALNQRANVLQVRGELEQAEESLRRAVELAQKAAAEHPGTLQQNRLAHVMANLAVVLAQRGDQGDEPDRLFQAAIERSRSLARALPNAPLVRDTLTDQLRGWANRLERQGRKAEARQARQEGIEHCKWLIEQPAAGDMLPMRHQRLGALLCDQAKSISASDPATARSLLEAAIEHHKVAASTNPPDARSLEHLAGAYYQLSALLAKQQDLKSAEPLVTEQLALADRLLSQHGESMPTRLFQAWALENLAQLRLDSDRLAEAADAYRRAIEVRRRLAADHPSEPQYASQLATTLGMSARVLAREKNWVEMARVYTAAIGLQEAALKELPQNAMIAQVLVNQYAALAHAHARLKDHRAVADDAKICQRFPDLTNPYEWAARLASCVTLAKEDQSLSVREREQLTLQYRDRALELLKTAQRKGAPELPSLARDPAFQPLHGCPKFEELVAAVNGKVK